MHLLFVVVNGKQACLTLVQHNLLFAIALPRNITMFKEMVRD